MAGEHLHTLQREHSLRRKPDVHETDDQPGLAVKPQGIIGLQRYIGNQGVQRLLAQGTLTAQGLVQRCNCGGKDDEV
jgi:hypothetical protein